MDFRQTNDNAPDAGGTSDAFPNPENADPQEVEAYNRRFLETHPDMGVETQRPSDESNAMDTPFAKADAGLQGDPEWKAKFPWLYEPSQGRRWDFDPVELRMLSQENAWVQMMVQSITKEIAETSWTITTVDDARETDKRLSKAPGERSPIEKDLPDSTAEDIYEDLRRPVPHLDWSDAVEMWMRDYLEVGSMVASKVFDERYYDDDNELAVDAEAIDPLAIQPTAPEVWTKDYSDKSGIPSGYWQFSRRSSPGGTHQTSRGVGSPTHFDQNEVLWSDNSPTTNRGYGDPPTLFVSDFIQSVGLAVDQEQNYLSRGSIPSGAWVFEEWDREQVLEWKAKNAENIKGKPHKSLMFAGRGGDVSFEPMSMNFQELEFTERMKWYARVIAAAFQVPTAVVGIEPEKVNYNTFQGERENFETNTLGPYLQDFERWLNHGYVGMHYDGYRFEFTPGMSETTRQMRSERIRSEWNSNLRPRENAARELGIDLPESAEDGFKDDVVEESGDGGELEDVLASMKKERVRELESNGETKKDVEIRGDNALLTFSMGGVAVDDEGDDGDYAAFAEDLVDEYRATLLDLKTTANPDVDAVRYPPDLPDPHDPYILVQGATPDEVADVMSDYDGVHFDDPRENAEKSVGEMLTEANQLADVSKDEPLRNTDDWSMFDVQPNEVQSLADDLASDFEDLFADVLEDDEIRDAIESMAGDETDKSVTAVARRLKELLTENDLANSIQQRLEESSTREALEAVEAASESVGEDVDVDEAAIREQLRDRTQGFADDIAEDMAEDIRETVGDGFAEGKNSREIAEDISEQGDLESGWGGAERVARQELHVASGMAREEVAADLGKVEVWRTAGDDRVRDAHASMDGKWSRPGESWEVPYESGVEEERVQGDSKNGIGCRCTTALVDREDVDDENHAGSDGL